MKNGYAAFKVMTALAAMIATNTMNAGEKMNSLNLKEEKIAAAAAFAAKGDQCGLQSALEQGLDAGVTINEFKEVLVQAYAYCGFPRSLNALETFMKLTDERGGKDAEGRLPGSIPQGESLNIGAQNQTKLIGQPVKGAVYSFAPAIDEFLKSHLFGDIFARDNLDWKTREIATIAMLAAMEGTEAQLKGHIAIGKHNGVRDGQIDEILKIVRDEVKGMSNTSAFPLGSENTDYSQYFSRKSWLSRLTNDERLNAPLANVTFEPGCRNNWHSHTGGQILIAVGGKGFYQEKGKAPRLLLAGDVVEVAPNAVHWHGAAPDSWFSHLAIECNPQTNKNTWLESVSDEDYKAAASAEYGTNQ